VIVEQSNVGRISRSSVALRIGMNGLQTLFDYGSEEIIRRASAAQQGSHWYVTFS
jgi:hypothetical protein